MYISASQDFGIGLDKYIGKDVWVYVYDRVRSKNGIGWYVRFISSEGSYVYYNRVSWESVENEYAFPWDINFLTEEYKDPIKQFKLLYPIDVLTTDELLEIVTTGFISI